MPVKLGGSAASGRYINYTAEALEDLVVGEEVSVSNTGKFLKTKDGLQVFNQVEYYKSSSSAWSGGGSFPSGADRVGQREYPLGANLATGNTPVALSNGWVVGYYVSGNSAYSQTQHTLQCWPWQPGGIGGVAQGTHVATNGQAYWLDYTQYATAIVQELHNDGTNTHCFVWQGSYKQSGYTWQSHQGYIRVRNSDGYITTHQAVAPSTYTQYRIDWQNKEFTFNGIYSRFVGGDTFIECNSGSNSGTTLEYAPKRVSSTETTRPYGRLAFSQTGMASQQCVSPNFNNGNANKITVLNYANREVMLLRRPTPTSGNYADGSARLQYKILRYPATGTTVTTVTDWTDFTGSDEGGELTAAKTARAQVVRISDNNFAVIAAASSTSMEVQKWTWDPSSGAIAENGSKFTLTGTSDYGTLWRHVNSASVQTGIYEHPIIDMSGGENIFIYGGAYSGSRYGYVITKIDLVNNKLITFNGENIHGGSTYQDLTPFVGHMTPSGQFSMRHYVTTGGNYGGHKISLYKPSYWDAAGGVTQAKIGQITTAATEGNNATAQLQPGILSDTALHSSYYVTVSDNQYVLDNSGAPAPAGQVIFPTPTAVNFGRYQYSSNSNIGSFFNASSFAVHGSAYVNASVTTAVFELIGYGALNQIFCYPSNSTSKTHEMQFYIDDVMVYDSTTSYSGQPSMNYRNAWAMISGQDVSNHVGPTSAGSGGPIVFKKRCRFDIISPSAADTWYYRVNVTKY